MSSTQTGDGNRVWSPSPGKGNAPHRPTIASSLVAALVAVGVVLLFVLIRTGGPTVPSNTRTVPTTGVPATPSTTGPPLAQTTPPTTTASPSASGRSGTTPGLCTVADLHVSTTTDSAWYLPGAPVTATTYLRAVRACVLQPAAVAPYGCATSLVIVDALGHQVWPWANQGEVCTSPASMVLRAGVTESVRSQWNGQVPSGAGSSAAPPGTYQAVGTWAWSAGAGQVPVELSARSQPFSVS